MTVEDALQEVQQAYTRIVQAEARARYAYDHYLDGLAETYEQRLQEIAERFARERAEIEGKLDLQRAEAASKFEESATNIRSDLETSLQPFTWNVGGWEDPAWEQYSPPVHDLTPTCVRVGQLSLEDADKMPALPALAQFADSALPHLFVIAEGDQRDDARSLMQSILLRLVLGHRPGSVRLVLRDPIGMGANLSIFLRLPDAMRGTKVWSRPEEFQQQLRHLSDHVEQTVQTRLTDARMTLDDYNREHPEVAIPYHVLALTAFPSGFDERMANDLVILARNGPRAGVHLVACIDPSQEPPRNFDVQALTSLGTQLTFSGNGKLSWNDPEFGQWEVVPDQMPDTGRVSRWLSTITDAAARVETDLSFERIAIPSSVRWTASSIDGFRVPIGIAGDGSIHEMELGSGVVHHALIGGATGSGKSNLLHVLITQLALAYSPEELELYLIDFREGTEFQAYTALPHARAVSLETEREFALSLIRHVHSRMAERGARYRSSGAGAERSSDYRRVTGQVEPRTVLIMDEFQVLFSEDDAISSEAAQLLEDLVRRGRGFGIHVILSSQSPVVSGRRLDRVYGQVALRIALRALPETTAAILGEGNRGGVQLERVGEAIYNAAMGDPSQNQVVRVARLSARERMAMMSTIHQLSAARDYPTPVTFEGSAPAVLENNEAFCRALAGEVSVKRGGSVNVWLGEPIEMKPPTAAKLQRYPGSNLLIVGPDESAAHGLLSAAILSVAAQQSPADAQFYIAEFARPETPFSGYFQGFVEQDGLPHKVDVSGPRQASSMLSELDALLSDTVNSDEVRPDVYLVIAGVHRWRDLRSSDYRPSKGGEQLARILDEGPDLGIHVILWSDGLPSLDRAVKRGAASLFDLRVALRSSEQESGELVGSRTAASLADNRALFRDEEWELGKVEKFKPYPPTSAAQTESFVRTLARWTTSNEGTLSGS